MGNQVKDWWKLVISAIPNTFVLVGTMIVTFLCGRFLNGDPSLLGRLFVSFCVSIGTMLGVNSVLPKINRVLYQKRKKA
ncbi:MAG TPA: hypothetical protein DCW42_07690 [Bacteroidetes bacterium]|nr:hypothetical protein [Bacteroidota bacterium]